MDIKNSMEILEAIELLGVSGKKIAKDGVSLADLPEAIELLKKLDVLMAAIKDAELAVDEAKDLDQAELLQLGTKVYGVIKAIKEA